MRAMAVFPEKREIRIVDVPPPERAGAREVMVKMREVGICGTDREICGFRYGTPPRGCDRLIIGHESLAQVVEIGPGVNTVVPGDLVVLTVRRACDDPDCAPCRAGRAEFCVTGKFVERGIKDADGFMTELVVEDERNLVRVPATLAEVGVLVEPLTIAGKAGVDLQTILQRYPWEQSEPRALVLGAGQVGLLGAMMLLSRDVRTFVYSLEPADSERARLVRSIGAEYLSGADASLADVRTRIGPVDVVYEAVGHASVAFSAVANLAPNGIFVFTGVPGGAKPVEIDLDGIVRGIVLGNQVLFGTVNAARSTFEAAVSRLEMFMAEFPWAVRGLITERVALEDAPALLRGRSSGIKQVVTLSS